MQIPEKYFTEFKELYKKEFGEEEYVKMTEQQLLESATKLVTLMEVVYKYQNSPDGQKRLDKAYDILFEETLKSNSK